MGEVWLHHDMGEVPPEEELLMLLRANRLSMGLEFRDVLLEISHGPSNVFEYPPLGLDVIDNIQTGSNVFQCLK